MSFLNRYLQHLCSTHRKTKRCFDLLSLEAIEKAITDAEQGHSGQIRFVVETDLPAVMLWDEVSPRERAIQLFSSLHIWDTEHNNGVLIYVLLAEKRVEVVADRGIHRQVIAENSQAWEEICQVLERAYLDGNFKEGTITAVEQVANWLKRFKEEASGKGNELSNKPLLL